MSPQRNMGRFMKILLVKRLESSFYAFRKSIDRFIVYYQDFLEELERGNVYISKKHINKIFDLLAIEDLDAIEKIIKKGQAHEIPSTEFKQEFIIDLQYDLSILKKIGEYGDGIQNIEKEMQSTQNSFSKMVNPLTDNIRELQKITGTSSKPTPKTKSRTTKSSKKDKVNFEDYLR